MHVFISHSSWDRAIAETLCKAIEARGQKCWIATRDIHPGDGFQDSIVKAIEASHTMVLVFSQHSNQSAEIKKELALAGQYTVPIIPVRIEDVFPTGAFRYELVTRQWIDLFTGWEKAIERIVARIREIEQGRGDGAAAGTPPSGTSKPPVPKAGAGRRWLWPGVSAVLAAVVVGIGAYFWINMRSAGDEPAHYPETPATRLAAFVYETPPQEERPGRRKWTRVVKDRWVEEYPDGSTMAFNVVGRTHVEGCDGTIIRRSTDANFQAFLPDLSCNDLILRFRRLPNRAWAAYVTIRPTS